MLEQLKANLRSAGWEVQGATLLVTERLTRYILGLYLQRKMGIHTTQKAASSQRSRFYVLLCEHSEGWKQKIFMNDSKVFLIVRGSQKTII